MDLIATNATQNSRAMTVNEARSVIWPFREIKGQPIGLLIDKRLISREDLVYAIQRANDWRVREAARTVLLHSLAQRQSEPEESAGPLNVVSAERRSFAERRQLQFAVIYGGILGFILAVLLYLFLLAFDRFSGSNIESSSSTSISSATDVIALVIVLIILVGMGLLLGNVLGVIADRLLFDRLERQMRLHRKGQLGEERVLNIMYGVLDGRWWLFKNLELPGRRLGDLDFVLVGPYGMWSFEVKAYSGDYRNVGERWEKRYGAKWRSVSKNPTRQARRNAAGLSQLLSTHQIKQWITPVIIWANPDSTVALDSPSTDVWTLDQLSDRLQGLSGQRPMPEAQIQGLVVVLKDIYKKQDDPEY